MPAKAGPRPLGSSEHAAPVQLHRSRLWTRLHRALPPCAPSGLAAVQTSDAIPHQASCLVTVLLVQPFVVLFRLSLPRLLRPLLTSGSTSSASGFHPQGQISPGKNAILHRTTAAFTTPDPWPQELRSRLPARPGRRRLRCDSCTSAHGLRSTLPPHARSPSRSCVSLASLWPARPGTCTPKIAPMLGAQAQPGWTPGEHLQRRVGPIWGHPGAGAIHTSTDPRVR